MCYLLSALHNEHWGQSAKTVMHWLTQAVRDCPSTADTLVRYFAMSVPDARFWLSPAPDDEAGRMH